MAPVTLDDIECARRRIAKHVRRTPLVEAKSLRELLVEGARVTLKLECLQVTGSFKARGATSKLFALSEAEVARGLVTASGGNHGQGVAYAGWLAGAPTRIYMPVDTPPAKAERLARWGAESIYEGTAWDDSNEAACAAAEREGLTYVHPFADPLVIAGQGTIAPEVLEAAPETDTLLVAIGGGGLISGIAVGAKALKPDIRVIGIEPTGAPTLANSLATGALTTLGEIGTAAGTLAPRRSAQINLDLIRENVAEIVLVDDDEMRRAARWLWFEMGLAVELSGAAAVAALQTGKVRPGPGENVCALVCGIGTDGLG